jgi:hypothetical protein
MTVADPLSKVESRLGVRPVNSDAPLAFIVLSGAFNPVHTQHVAALHLVRAHCERRGWFVIGGFLAPSSDQYVRGKLGPTAMPLDMRITLCERATADSNWISVWPEGELSGYRVAFRIRQRLLALSSEVSRENEIYGIEVMGSETAIRILEPIADEWRSERMAGIEPWFHDRVVCCLVRPGGDHAGDAEHLTAKIAPAITAAGVQLMLVDTEPGSLHDVSSEEIRSLISASNWEELRNGEYLHPRVLDALAHRK